MMQCNHANETPRGKCRCKPDCICWEIMCNWQRHFDCLHTNQATRGAACRCPKSCRCYDVGGACRAAPTGGAFDVHTDSEEIRADGEPIPPSTKKIFQKYMKISQDLKESEERWHKTSQALLSMEDKYMEMYLILAVAKRNHEEHVGDGCACNELRFLIKKFEQRWKTEI